MNKPKAIGTLVLLGLAFLSVSGCLEDNRSIEELTKSEMNALADCTVKHMLNTSVENQLRIMLGVRKEKGDSIVLIGDLFNETIKKGARKSMAACAEGMGFPVIQKCLELPEGSCKP